MAGVMSGENQILLIHYLSLRMLYKISKIRSVVYRKRKLLAFRVLWDRHKKATAKNKHVIKTSSCPCDGKTTQEGFFR